MTAATPVFLYGTLRDPELLGVVSGRALDSRPALLRDHSVCWAEGEEFPLLFENPGGTAEGFFVEVAADVLARLDFYEMGFGYRLHEREVEVGGRPVYARVYFPDPGLWKPGAPFSLTDWQRDHGELAREAAVEYMRMMPWRRPDEAAQAFPGVRSRASSRLRAKAMATPSVLEPHFDAGMIDTVETRQPYTGVFAVREDVLTHPSFDGGRTGPILRTSFMGGDAVTVLPYDPIADSVLVVRQFRHGPFVRGDANPWCIEPVAGRIDPGESAEETARREMMEETGLEVGDLFQIGAYYPTPGAFSEHTTSFVALADLTGFDQRLGGEEHEHEDILSHVLPYHQIMRIADEGAINTGMLLLSLLWLQANRDRLRSLD